jgi:N6-adenosine-specific RNA methylase IME4
MEAWGFTYKTVAFVWVKTTKAGTPATGMGFWTRSNAEIVLLGTRGHPKRLAKNVGQIILAPRGEHSVKPEEVQDRIEALVPGPYLELFARRARPGWACHGDQLPQSCSQEPIA